MSGASLLLKKKGCCGDCQTQDCGNSVAVVASELNICDPCTNRVEWITPPSEGPNSTYVLSKTTPTGIWDYKYIYQNSCSGEITIYSSGCSGSSNTYDIISIEVAVYYDCSGSLYMSQVVISYELNNGDWVVAFYSYDAVAHAGCDNELDNELSSCGVAEAAWPTVYTDGTVTITS